MCVVHEKKCIFEGCIPGENLSQVTNKKSEEKIQITQQKNDQRKWKHVSKKIYKCPRNLKRYSRRKKKYTGTGRRTSLQRNLKRGQREPQEKTKTNEKTEFPKKEAVKNVNNIEDTK